MALILRSQFVTVYGALLGTVLMLVGCDGPEMPAPPPRESTNPVEDDFAWIIERMEHALRMFHSPSSLGLRIKRSLQYKVISPTDKQPNYTAVITVTTKAIYDHGKIPSTREREQAERKRAAQELKLDDPYDLPGEQVDDLGIDVPSVEQPTPEVPAPVIPAQSVDEKREYLLEYVNNHWELKTEKLEESERMWFDYALQTGEFGPDPQ